MSAECEAHCIHHSAYVRGEGESEFVYAIISANKAARPTGHQMRSQQKRDAVLLIRYGGRCIRRAVCTIALPDVIQLSCSAGVLFSKFLKLLRTRYAPSSDLRSSI